MHGSLHFELSKWKSAAENLKKAQLVYENLSSALPDEEQALYKAKVDELTPSGHRSGVQKIICQAEVIIM